MKITDSREKQIDKIFDSISALVPTDSLISCPDWAEEKRYMNTKISGRSGRFSFTNAPYCREIADCFSKTNPVQEVAIMKGVQLGLTTSVIENAIGYVLDVNPAPMMFVFPNEEEAKKYKKVKIDNLVDNSGLREKIFAETENRNTRRTGDTSTLLEFPGGSLLFASANNENQLRSFPIKNLFLDELDAYPDKIKGKGDPVKIAVERTASYIPFGRKICYNSTPLLAHNSKIFEKYKQGDCRKFFVPCPICGEMQELVFFKSDGGLYSDEMAIIKENRKTKPFGLMFDVAACKEGDYSSVRYKCQHCGGDFKDYSKLTIEQKGEWRPTQKSKIPNFRSYHISALYSLTKPWEMIVRDFIEAGTDPQKLQVFYNLDLGLPFEEKTGGVEYQQVQRLRDLETPNNYVPQEALILTCAVDVQRDRLEVEIEAWGDRFRCWSIDHRVFKGDTSNISDDCWQKLKAIKDETFTDGRLIDLGGIDSGDGETTDVVYDFCEMYGDGFFMPLKGFVSTNRTREKFKIADVKTRETLSLVEIYVDLYKNTISRYFAQEERVDDEYPDGWHTFAQSYSDEFFRQLTTERRVKKKLSSGIVKTVWEQHGRNEAFDLCVYNLAMLDVLIQQTSLYIIGLEGASSQMVFEYYKRIREIKGT